MKVMFHFDNYHKDVWSGREIDYDMWFVFKSIWNLSELAVVNVSDTTLSTAGRENITIYNTLADFVSATSGPYICLEHPKHSPSQMLDSHTFDDTAWYCIGPTEGWVGNYISGSTTLGIEQSGDAEMHAPFVSAVLSYKRYMAG